MKARIEADLWDDDDDTEPGDWEKGTGLYQRALDTGSTKVTKTVSLAELLR